MSKELIAPGAQLLGSAGKIISGISSSSAVSRQAKSAVNQIMANSRIGVMQTQRQARQVEGKQRAVTAGAGLVPDGTPLEVMMDSANQAQLQIELIKRNALIEAENVKQRAAYARANALSAVTTGFGELGVLAMKNETLINELWRKATGGEKYHGDIHEEDMAGIY